MGKAAVRVVKHPKRFVNGVETRERQIPKKFSEYKKWVAEERAKWAKVKTYSPREDDIIPVDWDFYIEINKPICKQWTPKRPAATKEMVKGAFYFLLGTSALVLAAVTADTDSSKKLRETLEDIRPKPIPGPILGDEILDMLEIEYELNETKHEGQKQGPSSLILASDLEIMIDPGHGYAGNEEGGGLAGTTLVGDNKIAEHEYVLGVGKELSEKLEGMGYKNVGMTRTGATSLKLDDRKNLFDKNENRIGLSIHVNGCNNTSVKGARIYANEKGQALAKYFAEELGDIFGICTVHGNEGYRVLQGANPAILIELGFGGSNAEDANTAVNKQDKIVDALAKAVSEYDVQVYCRLKPLKDEKGLAEQKPFYRNLTPCSEVPEPEKGKNQIPDHRISYKLQKLPRTG